MNVYHIGLLRGTGPGLWSNGHKVTTVVLQARSNKDYLSPDLWKYYGPREITKRELRAKKAGLLKWINTIEGEKFTRIIID